MHRRYKPQFCFDDKTSGELANRLTSYLFPKEHRVKVVVQHAGSHAIMMEKDISSPCLCFCELKLQDIVYVIQSEDTPNCFVEPTFPLLFFLFSFFSNYLTFLGLIYCLSYQLL